MNQIVTRKMEEDQKSYDGKWMFRIERHSGAEKKLLTYLGYDNEHLARHCCTASKVGGFCLTHHDAGGGGRGRIHHAKETVVAFNILPASDCHHL